MTNRLEHIESVRQTLLAAGFAVSPRCDVYPSSFDIICKRDDEVLLVKILLNIDSMDRAIANELQLLGRFLSASPLLIGEQGNASKLEDDVIYVRHKIPAMTLQTAENIFVEGVLPIIYAGPGGFYVELDNKKLRHEREQREITIGTMARIAGVSRETIRNYENKDRCSATVDAAIRIEEYLEESIVLPFNRFSLPLSEALSEKPKKMPKPNPEDIKNTVFFKLNGLGYNVTATERSPFNAIAKDANDALLFTGVGEHTRSLAKKARMVYTISQITNHHSVFFMNHQKERETIEGNPIITLEELKKIKDPEKIVELIIERLKSTA